METPAIIVVAYNRVEALKRILSSLEAAYFDCDVRLVISIDHGAANNPVIRDIANQFIWKHGTKEVVSHKDRLGLRKHILACGDMTETYGSVIVLEDDLYVSPYFYRYAQRALEYYADCSDVAGISLYSHKTNPVIRLPFNPLCDGHDVFFLKFASSWGQVWTHNQWHEFKEWYDREPDINRIAGIPGSVLNWPASSWLKYFIAYLVDTGRYFVYPRESLTTNFCDPGEHHGRFTEKIYQVPLLLGDKHYSFVLPEKSLAVYDAFFEIESKTIRKYNSFLGAYDFEADLYGSKQSKNITSEYVITSRHCVNAEQGYAFEMQPAELNILFDIQGDSFSLASKENVCWPAKQPVLRNQMSYLKLPATRLLAYSLLRRLLGKFGRS